MNETLNIFVVVLDEKFKPVAEVCKTEEVEHIDDLTGVVTLKNGELVKRDEFFLINSQSACIAVEGGFSMNDVIVRKRNHCKNCGNGAEFENKLVFSALKEFLYDSLISKLKMLKEKESCPVENTCSR